ncbi:MAG: adenosine deaminase [Acidimicrobiia bacterium]|nr:adenosine deaminase [Acidimicrobiia bacterium]
MREWLRGLPKAELHLHIEGTLEPELMFKLAQRNGVELPFANVEEAHQAYVFDDLQSFLDIYYAGCSVLVTEADFADLTQEYLTRAAADGVLHTEIFFDPQTHTDRGISFGTVVAGITRGLEEGEREFGISSRLIMCFLRHLDADAAMATLEEALEFRGVITAVGLDSGESGNPPEKFEAVFDRARAAGFLTVAHAGEEGPPDYIRQAIDMLGASRIDHGVRVMEDPELVDRLVAEQVPCTVCPLSNVKLRVFPSLGEHPLRAMLQSGLRVSINSDDPAYFGGYIAENYIQTAQALAMTTEEMRAVARNSVLSSFLDAHARHELLAAVDAYPGMQ